ncbi:MULTISPECIES: hypothetical protein [Legionella]|uniref:Uncharacterized protein n=1 Tax=Legionella drozanskii LLAP-1 TaxID=1212489 RepID=A0A0W0T0Y3_9GAMM|nr:MULTISPECIES: hypothetical protein [Legionella]KTC89256.1 hypothetical protein Ldro_0745 [Legionella drozanskii LLAP-1]PJE13406.1 MAG: hypothetical protein CK430_06520 [Legionella sp.]
MQATYSSKTIGTGRLLNLEEPYQLSLSIENTDSPSDKSIPPKPGRGPESPATGDPSGPGIENPDPPDTGNPSGPGIDPESPVTDDPSGPETPDSPDTGNPSGPGNDTPDSPPDTGNPSGPGIDP